MNLAMVDCKTLPRVLCAGFSTPELNALQRAAGGAFAPVAAPASHPLSAIVESGLYAAVVCKTVASNAGLSAPLLKRALLPVLPAPHPFDPYCLAADLAAELDRPGTESRRRGRLELEPATAAVSYGAARIQLTENQFDLLWRLAYRPGQICPRGRLARAVGGDDPFGRSLDMHISRLRTQLMSLGLPRGAIRSVRGRGYQLKAEAIA